MTSVKQFFDFNQTLQHPEGYGIGDVQAQGEYLRVDFFKWDDTDITVEHIITVYLNGMGREVGRVVERAIWPERAVPTKTSVSPAPIGRWFRIRNGFLIVLQGIQEMFR